MKLLLDTHIWLWSLLAPDKLTRKVARALTNEDNELWLSSISVWEMCILVSKGRIQLDKDPGDWLVEAFDAVPLREAPVTHEIALETSRIDLPYPDPADRFLVATARLLDLTLVTADRRVIEHRPVATLSNR